jgi:hypothetical protein
MNPTSESGAQPVRDSREPVNSWLEIGSSGIHGRGGFARRAIPMATTVVEYVGDRIDKAESARRCEDGNPYIFTINDDWDLDGDVPGNPARFLNHSCDPNCEAQQEEDRIWIVALRDIAPGEELTFNYGYDLEEWRDHPCECGATGCLGYIVAPEFHEQIRRELARDREPEALGSTATATAAGAMTDPGHGAGPA